MISAEIERPPRPLQAHPVQELAPRIRRRRRTVRRARRDEIVVPDGRLHPPANRAMHLHVRIPARPHGLGGEVEPVRDEIAARDHQVRLLRVDRLCGPPHGFRSVPLRPRMHISVERDLQTLRRPAARRRPEAKPQHGPRPACRQQAEESPPGHCSVTRHRTIRLSSSPTSDYTRPPHRAQPTRQATSSARARP
ncbi:MAG: hypothetical protein BWY59_01202 [Verrucomicrobia bacterium ADurb.Bin345]|nr:MAG: hypothetical protein BWY59_01202 [Verrucomicrobia bacterium ADurb.Bin345]